MVKAIETRYKGYRMRSRLEARWAVFFDALGVKWEYEKEGYQLSTGWYLPDFWLPEFNFFVEIKPNQECQWEHCSGVAAWSEEEKEYFSVLRVILCTGDPGDYIAYDYADEGLGDMGKFSQCPKCKMLGFTYCGWAGYIGCSCFACKCHDNYGCHCGKPYKESGIDHFLMQNAVIAARSARFEHGENGASK